MPDQGTIGIVLLIVLVVVAAFVIVTYVYPGEEGGGL